MEKGLSYAILVPEMFIDVCQLRCTLMRGKIYTVCYDLCTQLSKVQYRPRKVRS